MFALGGIMTTLIIWLPEPLLFSVWVGETLILVWTHRLDLRQRPCLRPWLGKHLQQPGD
jgi:hypothetical protein